MNFIIKKGMTLKITIITTLTDFENLKPDPMKKKLK